MVWAHPYWQNAWSLEHKSRFQEYETRRQAPPSHSKRGLAVDQTTPQTSNLPNVPNTDIKPSLGHQGRFTKSLDTWPRNKPWIPVHERKNTKKINPTVRRCSSTNGDRAQPFILQHLQRHQKQVDSEGSKQFDCYYPITRNIDVSALKCPLRDRRTTAISWE